MANGTEITADEVKAWMKLLEAAPFKPTKIYVYVDYSVLNMSGNSFLGMCNDHRCTFYGSPENITALQDRYKKLTNK